LFDGVSQEIPHHYKEIESRVILQIFKKSSEHPNSVCIELKEGFA
jgi:hypothetical protein